MPVEFLSDEQAARYGRYQADPNAEQLIRYFYLSPADVQFLAQCRRTANKLGCAVQLGTLRFLGTFLPEPTQVPAVVVQTLATQLGVDPAELAGYRRRPNTWHEHQPRILAYLGYQPYDAQQSFRLTRWLYAQVLTSTVRPSVLVDLATAHLVAQRVVLPGVTVLARLIARVRERTGRHLYRQLHARLTGPQRTALAALLIVPAGERLTHLELLRTPPTRVSAPALVAAMQRVDQIRALGVSAVPVADLPEARLARLARHAQLAWAQTLVRMGEERRLATLLVFVQALERTGEGMEDQLGRWASSSTPWPCGIRAICNGPWSSGNKRKGSLRQTMSRASRPCYTNMSTCWAATILPCRTALRQGSYVPCAARPVGKSTWPKFLSGVFCSYSSEPPFMALAIKKGYFTVEHYRGSAQRWTRFVTFKYDPTART
jgi:hypothetical protein